jgi:hypothetical protein
MPTRRLTQRVCHLTRPATAPGTAGQLELLKLAASLAEETDKFVYWYHDHSAELDEKTNRADHPIVRASVDE